MKVLEGHLTPKDRQVVKAILGSRIEMGAQVKYGKNVYRIEKNTDFFGITDGTMTVSITTIDKGLIPVAGSPLRRSVYTAKISV